MTNAIGTAVVTPQATDTKRPYLAIGGLLAPITVVYLLLLLLPLVLVALLSVSASGIDLGHGFSFTLSFYEKYFHSAYEMSVLWSSIYLSVVCSVIVLVVAYPLAYFMSRTSPRARRWLTLLVALPFLMSAVVRTIAWTIMLTKGGVIPGALAFFGIDTGPVGLLFTKTGIVIGLAYIALPYMILVLATALDKVPERLEEAAGSLGANGWTKFWLVVFPLSIPGVLAGTLISFTASISSFVVPAMLGGAKNNMVGNEIYTQTVTLQQWSYAGAMSTVLVAVVVIASLGYSMLAGRLNRSA